MARILTPDDIKGLHGKITLDVETDGGFHPHLGDLVGLGVWAEDSGIIGYVPSDSKFMWREIKRAARTWEPGSTLICHNIKYELKWMDMLPDWLEGFKIYDCLVAEHLLHEEFQKDLGSVERRYLDTGSKKALLAQGKEYGGIKKIRNWPVELQAEYCVNDCRITLEVAKLQPKHLRAQRLAKLFNQQMDFVRELYRMESRGILLDNQKVEQTLDTIASIIDVGDVKLKGLLEEQGVDMINYRSPQQLSTLLYETLKIPRPVMAEELKGTQKEKLYTKTLTSKILLKELDHPVSTLIVKIKELYTARTYLNKYSTLSEPASPMIYKDWLPEDPFYIDADGEKKLRYSIVRANFNPTGTITGRLSGSNPNLQQVKAAPTGEALDPDGKGILLRPHFVARKGYKIVSIDYKQMEVVVFAILSQDPRLLEMVASGEDAHDFVAELLYGKRGNPYRKWVKTTNFGILYGLGDPALAMDLGMSVSEAAAMRSQYMNAFKRVRPWMTEINTELRLNGFLTYWSGRRRRIPNMEKHYKGVNSAVQGGCADMLSEAINRVGRFLRTRPHGESILAPVHDELVMELWAEGIDETMEEVRALMAVPDLLGTALNTDAEYGDAWGEIVEVGAGEKVKAGKLQREADRQELEDLLEDAENEE